MFICLANDASELCSATDIACSLIKYSRHVSKNIADVDTLIAMFSIWQHFTLLDCMGRVCRCWHTMTTLFTKAIKGNESTLAEFLDVDGLWIELQTRNILNDRQLENCRSQVSHLSISETARAFYIFISTVPGAAKNNPIKPCFFLFSQQCFKFSVQHFTRFFEFNDWFGSCMELLIFLKPQFDFGRKGTSLHGTASFDLYYTWKSVQGSGL